MKRLKELREAKGLTIRELAKELDVNYSTLHQNEIGDRVCIKEELLIKVCNYFNVTPNYLLGYEESSADELKAHYEAKIAELEAEHERRLNAFMKGSERTIDFIADEHEKVIAENEVLKEIILKQSILLGGKASEFRKKKGS